MCRVIDTVKTRKNIEHLMAERGLTARDIRQRLGFAERRPVCFRLAGKNLPSTDNLLMPAEMMHVSMDDILVRRDEYRQQRSEPEHG